MDTFSVGFSAVIFALKVLENWDKFDQSSHIGIPIVGDYFTLTVPASVPTFTQHWFELVIISIVLPRADFWGHLSGIVTGYIFGVFWWLVDGKGGSKSKRSS